MSRAYTHDEIQDLFLKHVESCTDYWDRQEPNKRKAMEGLAFSIMTMIDGCAMGIPGFSVMPCPYSDDKAYHKDRGENWFPKNVDIGGSLHELIFKDRKPL